jgi:hypothetical protein
MFSNNYSASIVVRLLMFSNNYSASIVVRLLMFSNNYSASIVYCKGMHIQMTDPRYWQIRSRNNLTIHNGETVLKFD